VYFDLSNLQGEVGNFQRLALNFVIHGFCL